MPVLHRYKDHSGYYSKAQIQQAVITYQLTAVGIERLLKAGVKDGDRYPRVLLLDLIRSGDAFTHGQGVAQRTIDPNQVELAFDAEEDLFARLPKCEETGSALDLHLIVTDEAGGERRARLLNPEARQTFRAKTGLSIPLSLITLGMIKSLEDQNKLPQDQSTVEVIRKWLLEDLRNGWEEFANARNRNQEELKLGGEELF